MKRYINDDLINDKSNENRRLAALQSYGLDILVNDEAAIVRRAALDTLFRTISSLQKLLKECPERSFQTTMTQHELEERNAFTWSDLGMERLTAKRLVSEGLIVRGATYPFLQDENFYCWIADGKTKEIIQMLKELQSIDVSKFVYDEDESIRAIVAKQGYGADVLVHDEWWVIRYYLACKGCRLDILVNDEEPDVRKAVAWQKYGLDILVNDEDSEVRIAVAMQNYGLDILVNDKDPKVRKAVARQGYGLDVLISDENPEVREAVAEQGYGLDVLINDKNTDVRIAVIDQGYNLSVLVNDENEKVQGYAKWFTRKIVKGLQKLLSDGPEGSSYHNALNYFDLCPCTNVFDRLIKEGLVIKEENSKIKCWIADGKTKEITQMLKDLKSII